MEGKHYIVRYCWDENRSDRWRVILLKVRLRIRNYSDIMRYEYLVDEARILALSDDLHSVLVDHEIESCITESKMCFQKVRINHHLYQHLELRKRQRLSC